MEQKYIAFISYRHKKYDSFLASVLHSRIEQYLVPKELQQEGCPKRLGRVFRDKEELAAAPDLTKEICQALDASENLIVLCTKATTAEDSHWVAREIAYFRKHHPDRKVFAVLAQGEPDQVYPRELRTAFDPETGEAVPVDPVAADIRGKNLLQTLYRIPNELLRIYAAMLHVDYPRLADRHGKRRRRQAAAAASVFAAVVLSFMGMLLYKNHQIRQTNLQLEQANTTLKQQKEDLLLRSAQLLVQDAEESLQEQNCYAAIQSATQAMTREDGSLFYHAPAERVLLSALNIFDKSSHNVLISSTAMEADGPIDDVCFSENGSITLTIDRFGSLAAFDSLTGHRLWQQRIDSPGTESQPSKLYALPGGIAAAFSQTEIAAFAIDTGEVLWRRDDALSNSNLFLPSPDGSSLLYIHSAMEGTDFLFRHSLVFLSADTGEVLQQIPLAEDRSLMDHSFSLPENVIHEGCFSADGSLFAGSYQTHNKDLTRTIHYYLADRNTGTLNVLCSRVSDGYLYKEPLDLILDSENRLLYVLNQSGDDSVAAEILKIDLNTGAVLWQTATLEEENRYFEDSDRLFFFLRKNRLYVLRRDKLYTLLVSDGTCVLQADTPGTLLRIEAANDNYFSTVTEGGDYFISWINSTGLRSSAEREEFYNLGDIQKVYFWKQGFLQGVSVEDMYSHTMVGDLDSDYGFAAVIPKEDNHTLILRRPLIFPEAAEQTDILLPEDSYLSELTLQPFSDGKLAVFPYTLSTDLNFTDHIALFDTRNHLLQQLYPLPEGCLGDCIQLLPEGSGYLECQSGRIARYSLAGESTILWQGEPIPIPDSQWADYEKETASVTLADGNILTVLAGEEGLTLWTNGDAMQSIPFPADLKWSTPGTVTHRRLLAAGENGYILLSHYDAEDSTRLSQFAAYHVPTGSWTRFPDEARGADDRKVCFGCASALAAVIDADDTARIYDLAEGGCQMQIPLGISGNSVAFARLLLEDTVLMVKTSDCQLLFFDIATGLCLYREQLLTGSAYTPVTVRVDDANQRLYLIDEAYSLSGETPNCICLDLGSWEPLFRVAGVLGFDPDQGELYVQDGYNDMLIAYQIPSTEALLEVSRQLIQY